MVERANREGLGAEPVEQGPLPSQEGTTEEVLRASPESQGQNLLPSVSYERDTPVHHVMGAVETPWSLPSKEGTT